jgi:hypothetical protein
MATDLGALIIDNANPLKSIEGDNMISLNGTFETECLLEYSFEVAENILPYEKNFEEPPEDWFNSTFCWPEVSDYQVLI